MIWHEERQRPPATSRRWREIARSPPLDQLLAAVSGHGIRIKHIAPDMKALSVEMKLRFWNANYVGTQFGGSLFAMTDPFYMLMLIANLGPDYIVWDKAATIRYRKPGKGTVRAEFRLSESQIEDVREKLKTMPKYEPLFSVEVKDKAGVLIAEVEKVIHVRKKQAVEPSGK
jgi:hypothetical protein